MADAPWIRINTRALAAVSSGRISSSDFIVLSALSARASQKPPRQCWPSLATISKDCGFSRRSVIRSIERLQAAALVDVQKRNLPSGLANSNVYLLRDDVQNGAETVETTLANGDAGVTTMVTPVALHGDTGVTQTRSNELDPIGTRTVVCKDLVSKKEQIAKLGEISAADLKNAGRLVELQNLAARLGLAREGQRAIHDFFAAAVYAVRSGDDPARLLCGLLRNGAFLEPVVNVGSEDDAEAGRAMFSAWRRSQAEPGNFARQLAAEWFSAPGAREAQR